MSIESFNLLEHFDYLKNYIPQPFFIHSNEIKEFKQLDDNEYAIVTNRHTFSLSKSAAKRLVDSLGIKIKLFSSDSHEETDVIEQIMPAINKLLKCFAECFVFYAGSDDPLTIIDLNVNDCKGAEGSKYENGPSPWKLDTKEPSNFTCFTHFINNHSLDDNEVLVKADDVMSSPSNVLITLFKNVSDSILQPMVVFSSKFSNMSGFTDIHPVLYDIHTDTNIIFPINFAKNEDVSFSKMWEQTLHLSNSTSLDDYIFREINELAASDDVPSAVKSFIATIQIENTLNVNQPIKDILSEAQTIANGLKPGKAKKFKKALGTLIGFCLVAKHYGCHECGSIHMN